MGERKGEMREWEVDVAWNDAGERCEYTNINEGCCGGQGGVEWNALRGTSESSRTSAMYGLRSNE